MIINKMENLNKIYISFPPNLSNGYTFFKSEKALIKKDNLFLYFKTNTRKKDNINNKTSRNKTEKLLSNFSSKKSKNKIYGYLSDDNKEYKLKNKNFNINNKVQKKKKLNVNTLFYNTNKSDDENTKNDLEDSENNLNPIFNINNYNEKSRNRLLLNEETSTQDKKTFFTNETLYSYYKDLFKIKINLNKTKNFSLYKSKLAEFNNTEKKSSIAEYNHKLNKNEKNGNKKSKKIIKFRYPYKTKYIFKTRNFLPTVKFVDLPTRVIRTNKFYFESVKSETSKYFGNNFSILKKEQFSEKFRNPLINNNLLNENKFIKEENNKIIKEDIISGKKILNEIYFLKAKKSKRKYKSNMKLIYFKFKLWIIRFSQFCKLLEIKPYKYINLYYKHFNNKDIIFHELQLIKTGELITAIKSRNLVSANKLIEEYPTTVFSKDYFEYSPLHWAVKVKFLEMIPNLILYGCNPNSQNMFGDTPLHLAIKKNDYECTVLLLTLMANPFIKNNKGKKPFDDTKDYEMNVIYKKISNLYYINTFKRSKVFVNNIQNKFIYFIIEEFSTQISRDPLNIIENLSILIKKGQNDDLK